MTKAGDNSEPDRLYANKYRTTEDLEKGYSESVRGYQKERKIRESLEEENERLRRELSSKPTGPDPLMIALEESDVPVQAIQGFIRNEVGSAVHSMLGEALKPLAESQRALAEAQELYPDFDLDKARKAVNQDPVLAETYNDLLGKDPKAAYVLAYNVGKHSGRTADEKPVKELEPVGRTDATVPKGRRSIGETEMEGISEENYRKLLEHAQQTGDWTPFLRNRFSDTLGHLSDEPFAW